MRMIKYLLLALVILAPACTTEPPPTAARADIRPLTDTEARLAVWYTQRGSAAPVAMAKATAAARRPRLMAAVAAVESDGNPDARGRRGERGAWQVTPRHHGPVPESAEEQARQAEKLLEELISKSGGRLHVAVRKYNGTGPRAERYARKVMRLVREVPV